jgi:prophage maintenance system killer protein
MSIARLEPARQFTNRILLLNRFHTPDQENYEDAISALGQVHGGFPSTTTHEQCAYLIDSIAKHRPFDEANFRTAWDYVSDLLQHRDYDLQATVPEVQELGNAVWDMQDDAPGEAAAYLAAWFQPRIHSMKGA